MMCDWEQGRAEGALDVARSAAHQAAFWLAAGAHHDLANRVSLLAGGLDVTLARLTDRRGDDGPTRAELKADERAVEAQGTRALGEQLLRDAGKAV